MGDVLLPMGHLASLETFLLSATHMCLCVCVCSWPGGSREQGHRRTSYHVSQPTTKNDPYLESQCLYHGFKTLHDGLLGILKTMIDIIQHSPSRKKKKKRMIQPNLEGSRGGESRVGF
jgi:hypothetical protein